MKDAARRHPLGFITKSKFLRSVVLQVISIFLIVVIAVTSFVFYSFTSEVNKSLVFERKLRLEEIESTVSARMEAITSIAYNIGADKTFYLEAVKDKKDAGAQMSEALKRYLVGNDFVEYLAYHRLSEPDTLYISKGELSFRDFWSAYLHLDAEAGEAIIQKIQSTKSAVLVPMTLSSERDGYFAYTYPLPQFSENPKAFVLMMIPFSHIRSLVDSQLSNCSGEIAIFDAAGAQLYRSSNLEEAFPISADSGSIEQETVLTRGGQKYVLQKAVSDSNGWTYVSLIRLNDIISGVAARQLLFIVLLLILMVVAILAMLWCIIKQYKPISKLALSVSDGAQKADRGKVIDEEDLLSSTLLSLKDDSDKKQQFEAAYHEAEAANKAKSAFLSNMSHDIRTPMNAIVGMTEIALKHADDPAYVRECLKKVQVSSQYLLDIINNVLDMSRIEAGRFTLADEEVSLPKLIYDLITILNQSLKVKSQTLLTEVTDVYHETIRGDSVRLSQVFMNILSNAVKFTPNGGTLMLSIRETPSSEEGFGNYVFTFSDTGIGMSPEFVSHIFDTFTREDDSPTHSKEGTGLGMAIAKSFVEMMGGTIRCESVPEVGTTFTVTMHLKLSGASSAPADSAPAATARVLIAGEEAFICRNQLKLFCEAKADAEWIADFREAGARIASAQKEGKPFDRVLLNLPADLPDTQSVLRKIGVKPGSSTQFLLASRDPDAVDLTAAAVQGIRGFVRIPLFRSTVNAILDGTLAAEQTAHSEETIHLDGIRVLLVEDNRINLEIARTLISETGAAVEEAVNGKEAVDAFKNHAAGYYDIILMDLQMPVMNGYEATAAIRSVRRGDAQSIPIYAMTAKTFDEDVRQVREAGMNGHLAKPYVPQELYRILRDATRH